MKTVQINGKETETIKQGDTVSELVISILGDNGDVVNFYTKDNITVKPVLVSAKGTTVDLTVVAKKCHLGHDGYITVQFGSKLYEDFLKVGSYTLRLYVLHNGETQTIYTSTGTGNLTVKDSLLQGGHV